MSAAKAPRWHGLLLIDKPKGLSSHDVVGRVRRAANQKRVGHTGTLDPMATGLMAVLLGSATRLEPYLTKMDKTYSGRIELGLSTDSDDITGHELACTPGPWPTFDELLTALKKYEGPTAQIPPAYSAIKVDGQRAYKAARKGEALELAARQVTAYNLEITTYDAPFLDFTANVSSGYYIRSLARDLGADLHLGGALAALRRETVGTWSVADAVTLEELATWTEDDWRTRLIPPAEAIPHLSALTLNAFQAKDFCQGKLVEMDPGLRRDDGLLGVAVPGGLLEVAVPEAEGGEKYSPETLLDVARLSEREARVEGKASKVSGEYFSPPSAVPMHTPKNPLDNLPIKVLNTQGLLIGLATIISPQRPFLRPLRVFSNGEETAVPLPGKE